MSDFFDDPYLSRKERDRETAARSVAFARMAASAQAGVSSDKLEDLNERLDRLALVVEAMWSLLAERGLPTEELAARISELDAADGVVDGRAKAQATDCRSCGSKVAPGLPACQFCGAAAPAHVEPSPFQGL